MRKHLFPLAVAALTVILALPLSADDVPKSNTQTKPGKTHGHVIYVGVIETITGNRVTLKSGTSAPLTLSCTTAKISTPAKNTGATLADLNVGDKVRVQYGEEDKFGLMAYEITVLPSPKPAGSGTRTGQGKTGKPK